MRDQEQPLLANASWSGFTDENRRVFPAEISIAENQVDEDLWVQMVVEWVQMVVEADPEDDGAVPIRRWFPESGHERAPNREQLPAFGWRYL